MQLSANIGELKQLLTQNNKRITIVTHVNPDGDAISSSLGLWYYLQEKGHTAQCITPNACPEFLLWLCESHLPINAEENKQHALEALSNSDLIFCLDFGVPNRAKGLEEFITGTKIPCVNIDHHLDFVKFADYDFRAVEACSTAELIYHFIHYNDDRNLITPTIATMLFTGIVTDTGSFRYSSAGPNVHRIAADIMELGANTERVLHKIFSSNSERRTRFLGYCLSEKLHVYPEYHTAIISVSVEDVTRFGVVTGETEGIVNYALSLENINLGILLIEKRDHIKMSFRSVGKFPANRLAAHFEGGGHFHAAGGRSLLDLKKTEEKIKSLLENYRQDLDYSI